MGETFVERLDDEIGHPVLISKYKHSARERYRGFWVSLDHGMLCGDPYLANAIHRNMFGITGQELSSAESLEYMVEYVHRTLLSFDMHKSELAADGVFAFPKLSPELQEIYETLPKK